VKVSILEKFTQRKGQIAVLIDPDKCSNQEYLDLLIKQSIFGDIDYFFVGGSTVSKKDFETVVDYLSKQTTIPIVLFPGSYQQISDKADAILYLSLLSGRNPDYLIGHHVQSAQELWDMDIEVIPTAYILIDGGTSSSVAYISQTTPIPSDKLSIAKNTAIAGILQGKRVLFFDAGSGAKNLIPIELIDEVKKLNVPIIVGGGIKSIEDIENFKNKGVNIIVIGNHIENNIDFLIDINRYNKIKN
jgi:phosphoglycerol geranylgeranyltransferase